MYRIVLVDDDRIFIHGVERHLDWQTLGLTVCGIAYCGEDAIKLCKKTLPDIILTDVRMPSMDGIQSAVKIHEAHPNCHIIFMSAYAQAQDYRKAIQLGALDFLEKPLDLDDLTQTLQRAIPQLKPELRNMSVGQPSRIIRDVIKIIEERYVDNLSVDYLAKIVFFTPNYLSTLFRKETGKTINQYLTHCRIEAAADLLQTTNKTLTEICEAVGYRDVRHFSRVFQKEKNIKPSDFRRI